MNRRILLLAVFHILITLGATSLQAETVRLGYFVNAPHINIDENGHPTGVLVQFLNQVMAPEMGVTFQFIKQPLARVLASLDSGATDGAALFGYTQARAQRYNYPVYSFFNMKSVLAVEESAHLKAVYHASDVKGMHIAYAIGAIQTPFIRNNRISMELMGGENPLFRNLIRLKLGRIDAVYWPDEASVAYTLERNHLNGTLRILKLPEKPISLFTLFSKKTSLKNLPARYDKAFKKVGGIQRYQQMMTAFIHSDF